MRLPPGATGFHAPGGRADVRAFTAVCHHAARALGATIAGVTPAGVTPSFHTVGIAAARHHVAVLRHVTVPFIAFARPRAVGDATVTFVDHPGLAPVLATLSDARVLTADQLGIPLSQADLSALDRAEHDQIGYWTPATVGELLFNFWD
ncbi:MULTISPECIES: hypothetical protein [unclassified Micromonospora]|uniref:hypothetical protein n=1 Tax=unclassified Micromonospora TaxID=2617518 RepID=UPI0018906D23|nr:MULTISPECIES: hypothetical protein [unclassified Micromonospora]MBF5032143.1 hypothetical protein [Micromonospora sp. ANENR4]MCZ7477952.1 hypothetical protein [Micromonospora sp. WMMC273]WBC02659.1 hypothetical protein O7546_26665 [Micromonospora sp. WMMA1976]